MNSKTMFVVVFACLCGAAFADSYAKPAAGYARPEYVKLPQYGEAQAAALTNAAGAKASAAKIDAVNWDALNQYGYEIGVPLLAKPYGQLTNLYAASLQPRSLVGRIDPVFQKDSYGKVKYYSGSSIGVAVI